MSQLPDRQPDRKPDRTADRRARQSKYADVQVELTRMVFDGVMPTVLTGGISIAAATAVIAAHYADLMLWWLAVAIFGLLFWRVLVVRAFYAVPDDKLTADAAYRWELLFGISTLLYSCAIATVPIHVFGNHESMAEGWCAMGMFVIASGIGARVALRPWIEQSSGMVMLLGLSYVLLRSDAILVQCSTSSVLAYLYLYCDSIRAKHGIVVDQIRTKRQLVDLTQRDALTGLANRRHFETRLTAACGQAGEFSILYIDLDKFKAVNDSYGHGTGDILLQLVAERLRGAVRGGDLIARIGGDEFAILQSAPSTEATARALATRINQDMAAVFEIEGHALRIGASIGIRLATEREKDAAALLRHADSALYSVKKSGGGGHLIAEPQKFVTLHAVS
jgi:diguanylate cyclase (GGDEF)-like protein